MVRLLKMLGIGKTQDMTERWLVVGLGNPGPKYAGNRHNAGFMVVDALAAAENERWKVHRANAEVVETRLGGVPTVLVKPRTYMNLSGGPVAGLARFYKVPPARIVVVHDEMDIDFGAQAQEGRWLRGAQRPEVPHGLLVRAGLSAGAVRGGAPARTHGPGRLRPA